MMIIQGSPVRDNTSKIGHMCVLMDQEDVSSSLTCSKPFTENFLRQEVRRARERKNVYDYNESHGLSSYQTQYIRLVLAKGKWVIQYAGGKTYTQRGSTIFNKQPDFTL